ncbi:hypothetical protein [Dactylosporangium sp. NPDC000521]|uniref:hypothetical protein n=1 Tax=Dactylosporangium sp. NPDC000521 TaxID=3363975 RepID=UPI003675FB14
MRDTTLGRWMARLAVTVGVGVVALGITAAVAQASDADSEALSVKVGVVGAIQAGTEPLFVTEAWEWN